MNYYNRHIGDYSKKAGRLTMLEHGAYTLLLDAYYDRERPPTKQEAIEWSWARTPEEIAAVEFILVRFFHQDGEVYRQKRVDEEIVKYKEKSQTNKRIAQEREHKKKQERERTVNEPYTDGHLTNNQEPITNNQEKDKSIVGKPTARAKFQTPSLQDVSDFCNERGNDVDPERWMDHYTSNGWMVGKNRMKDWRAAVRTWEKNSHPSACTSRQVDVPAIRATTVHQARVLEDDTMARNLLRKKYGTPDERNSVGPDSTAAYPLQIQEPHRG